MNFSETTRFSGSSGNNPKTKQFLRVQVRAEVRGVLLVERGRGNAELVLRDGLIFAK